MTRPHILDIQAAIKKLEAQGRTVSLLPGPQGNQYEVDGLAAYTNEELVLLAGGATPDEIIKRREP